MVVTQVQIRFSTERNYTEKAFKTKNKIKLKKFEVYIPVSHFNARYWTKEWDRLHCIFKVV